MSVSIAENRRDSNTNNTEMSQKSVLTLQQVRERFRSKGVSMADWSRQHGFSYSLVRQIMAGGCKCNYGKSHKIAVALGLKHESDVDLDAFC